MEKPSANLIAQTALFSSLITLVIIGGVLFIARNAIIDYLDGKLDLPATTRATEVSRVDEDIVGMIEQVNPAVVSVIVTKDVPVYERYYENFDPGGFFGGFTIPRLRENGTEEREVGGGSGFIVSNDGLIVTNRHVVDDPDARYSVVLPDGTAYAVEVLARDPQFDIAILKISEPLQSALSYVEFGDSNSLRLGQTVVAIGNALAEFQNSVSVGVISGLSRTIVASDNAGHSEQLNQVIQTDAAINPGNSGGPLLNVAGEVVGVNVATSQGADNIGFALPVQVVKEVVKSVKEYGEIVRPYIGVRYTMITEAMAKQNNLEVNYGAFIIGGENPEDIAVIPGSPADLAGLVENDIILSIDGESLEGKDLATVLRTKSVGDKVALEVISKKERKTLSVNLKKAL
ncbi:MAG: trypsin-like peptidase domain-containing protein [Patescibacteria group bacterium]